MIKEAGGRVDCETLVTLKPCPFCGSSPETKRYGEVEPVPGMEKRGYFSFRIICRECVTVEMEGWPELEVAKKWNSRVIK